MKRKKNKTLRITNFKFNKLMEEMINYIEEKEVLIDSEWGLCENLEELIDSDRMPELWKKLKIIKDNCDG